MDLGLSEEQEMLKNFARDFLEKECPEKYVRDMEEDARGYSPEVWKKMADQGWQGLIIPEEHGGAGLGFLDAGGVDLRQIHALGHTGGEGALEHRTDDQRAVADIDILICIVAKPCHRYAPLLLLHRLGRR